jgi:hypothetical protein
MGRVIWRRVLILGRMSATVHLSSPLFVLRRSSWLTFLQLHEVNFLDVTEKRGGGVRWAIDRQTVAVT